jgi:FkbM family methyltransferase
MTMPESFASPERLPQPDELLASWRATAPEPELALCQKLWRAESPKPVWLLGRNEAAEILLAQGLSCAGVIDDFTEASSWRGLPIQRFDQVAAGETVVVNCVQCNQPVEASRRIAAAESLIALAFSDFFRAGLLPVEALPRFSAHTHAALQHNPDLYEPLWGDLQDPLSRKTFADVLSFRLTTDPWFLCHYRYRPDEQYFEDFLALPPAAVFVDAGAFQGETSLEFARRYPDHGAIYAFEPSDTNADVLEKQTLELQGLQLHRVGLSDEAGVLRFASELGSASRAIEEGNIEISVIRLDDLELKRADLIKMDLEGGENRALQGGVETIRRCRSRLAIGAYHDPNDFAILHRTAKDIHPESRFYLRHYTSGWAETDLFCVPL